MTRVMAVGVFDLLHAGHLHYMEQAKSLGDHLTVVVAHDDTVRKRNMNLLQVKIYAGEWLRD